jgi:translation initiation factor 1A|tara:strand:+ start:4675 stop:4938 length:264 start_codon:yes stop_codon:yes gene_type:complete
MLPEENELLARVLKMSGGEHLIVQCTDGKTRMARIRGKMKRRMWVRENDIVMIAPWDFKDDRADVLWRYTVSQVEYLREKKYLPDGL